MTTELEPCPFCGAPAEHRPGRLLALDFNVVGCFADACKVSPCVSVDDFDSLEKAKAAWNTRHVQAGFALVSTDPTEAMIQTMRDHWFGGAPAAVMTPQDCVELYKMMIATAQGVE